MFVLLAVRSRDRTKALIYTIWWLGWYSTAANKLGKQTQTSEFGSACRSRMPPQEGRSLDLVQLIAGGMCLEILRF